MNTNDFNYGQTVSNISTHNTILPLTHDLDLLGLFPLRRIAKRFDQQETRCRSLDPFPHLQLVPRCRLSGCTT